MKILADEQGWTVEVDSDLEPRKASGSAAPNKASGVFSKVSGEAHDELSTAPTEPCPPSDEAEEEGAMKLPNPPALPRELASLAKDEDGSKVA